MHIYTSSSCNMSIKVWLKSAPRLSRGKWCCLPWPRKAVHCKNNTEKKNIGNQLVCSGPLVIFTWLSANRLLHFSIDAKHFDREKLSVMKTLDFAENLFTSKPAEIYLKFIEARSGEIWTRVSLTGMLIFQPLYHTPAINT